MSVILFFSEYLIWIGELYMTRLFRQESDRDVSFHFKLSDLTRPVRLCLPQQERVGGTAGERTGREAKVH